MAKTAHLGKKNSGQNNPFRSTPFSHNLNEKCDQCPIQGNGGTVCWQGSSHCILHGSNLSGNKASSAALHQYNASVKEAIRNDENKEENARADALVQWQQEEGSWNSWKKTVLSLFG